MQSQKSIMKWKTFQRQKLNEIPFNQSQNLTIEQYLSVGLVSIHINSFEKYTFIWDTETHVTKAIVVGLII